MTKPLSTDLRERLVSVVGGGMSRRSAAKRFGVAASTAIKWVDQWSQIGDVDPAHRMLVGMGLYTWRGGQHGRRTGAGVLRALRW
jgi:transposase-like protein